MIPERTLLAGGLALTLTVVIGGCSDPLTPTRPIRSGDCLSAVNLNQLPKAIRRCDRVVAAFPNDPAPRNDRYLLHRLIGDQQAACRDIAHAGALARRRPAEELPLQLRTELEIRQKSCR